jgi:hypothetical protein
MKKLQKWLRFIWMHRLVIVYVSMQSLFLPLVVQYQRELDAGHGGSAGLTFALYEGLIIIDSIIGIKIFGKRL